MPRTKVPEIGPPKRRRQHDGASSSSSSQPTLLYEHPYHFRVQNDNEARILGLILEKPLLVTKFVDKSTLRDLGIKQGVKYLLQKGGLYDFAGKAAHTYVALTLEFLISMVRIPSSRGVRYTKIQCRMFNEPYTFTYDDIAQAFGWVNSNPSLSPPPDSALCSIFGEK